MIPATTERVPRHTAEEINACIRRQTETNVARYANAAPQAIDRRLRQLDEEWDIERTLEANAATVSLVGSLLGATVDRRFFLLPAAVAAFLLQHAVEGWCPPLTFFRRRGVRTASEIDRERYALKALRGDFNKVEAPARFSGESQIRGAMEAVSK